MALVETEQVLVAPAELLRRLGYFQGFTSDVDGYLEELLNPKNISYRPRSEMEGDPRFKQLIPYVIFRHTDALGVESLFQYTRGAGQGERRLHRKRSIGVGGHISIDDAARSLQGNPYEEGMRRELDEEVGWQDSFSQRCVGLINDDQTDVGAVHLGVVHLVDVPEPHVKPRESEMIDAGFRPAPELLGDLDHFETWSQICLKSLFRR